METARIEILERESKIRIDREGVLYEYEKEIKKIKLEKEVLELQKLREEMGLKSTQIQFPS